MELIRGWESQFTPDRTGGLRLCKASVYRTIGEEEGLGDRREGEIRVNLPGSVTSTAEGPFSAPVDIVMALEDQPEAVVKGLMPGEQREIQTSVRVEDSQLDSPYLLCLSRKPLTTSDWESLRTALPERYDTWTLTDSLDAVRFEIESGIRRWLALKGINEHTIYQCHGWVEYSYGRFPAASDLGDLPDAIQLGRWFRKGRKYEGQREYRLAWEIHSAQVVEFPDTIDIELTETGLGLFKSWCPPS